MAKRKYLDDISPNIYIVQKGDTLSSIAKKTSGDWKNYMQIAQQNNIENPDVIQEGQQLIIPEKFDKPLKLSEIPTKNRLSIIDDYSPNYDYIVEGNKIYYSRKGNKDYWVDISDNTVARKNLFNHIGSKYNYRGYEDKEDSIGSEIQKGTYDYFSAIRRGSIKKQSKRPRLALKTDKVSLTTPIHIERNSSIYTRPLLESNVQEKEIPIFDSIRDLYQKGINYITRQYKKQFSDDEAKTTLKLPIQNNIESNYGIIPESYTGDTIKVNNNQYIIPESINLNDVTLGIRNRGELQPIESEGAIITNFNGYVPYNSVNKKNTTATYMGIDANGKFKVGTIDKFSDGDYLTRTYENDVESFTKDKQGNQVWKEDSKHGNPGRYVPAVNIVGGGQGSLNILTSKNRKDSGTYGNITGGRVVLAAGNETRLVSGSIDDIEKQFNDLKKRHNAKSIKVYTLDNGSYNRGLRTKNKILTSTDLRNYDNQNNGGGNFMYLRSTPGFKSDTIQTPNIRTVNDESYKKGHSTVNGQKGVVLHHTAFMENSLDNVTKHLTNPKSEASSHVIIGYDGKRRVLATPDKVTFHAGNSVWNNRENVNDFMLGIEFQGDTNVKDLTDSQIKSAVEYLKPIIRKNNIPLENIVTHQQVRDLYNKYAREQGLPIKPSKPDINHRNYEHVIAALLKDLYYKRRLESNGKKSK